MEPERGVVSLHDPRRGRDAARSQRLGGHCGKISCTQDRLPVREIVRMKIDGGRPPVTRAQILEQLDPRAVIALWLGLRKLDPPSGSKGA